MKKLVHPLVALMILALGAFIVSPAQAKVYMPATGATFNNPLGSRSQQTVLMDQIIAAVNNVPSGSIIRVVAYSFDYQPVADALIAAKKRGAQVRLLIDSHASTAQIKQLRSYARHGHERWQLPPDLQVQLHVKQQVLHSLEALPILPHRRRDAGVHELLGKPSRNRREQVVE